MVKAKDGETRKGRVSLFFSLGGNSGTTGTAERRERRNSGTTETEETQTAADTSGTAADRSDWESSSESPALQGTRSEITTARDAIRGVPSGVFKENEFLSLQTLGALWSSVVSAAVPALSAAVCVSSVSVVPYFRSSVVPWFRTSVVPLFRRSVALPSSRFPRKLPRVSLTTRVLLALAAGVGVGLGLSEIDPNL